MSRPRFKPIYARRMEAGLRGKKGPNGRNICLCGTEVPKGRKHWCSDKCYIEGNWNLSRDAVFERDRGICSECQLDTVQQRKQWAMRCEVRHWTYSFSSEQIHAAKQLGIPPGRISCDWWDADHILPVIEGGTNALDNLRTLCLPCHKAHTKQLRTRLADRRSTAKLPMEVAQ